MAKDTRVERKNNAGCTVFFIEQLRKRVDFSSSTLAPFFRYLILLNQLNSFFSSDRLRQTVNLNLFKLEFRLLLSSLEILFLQHSGYFDLPITLYKIFYHSIHFLQYLYFASDLWSISRTSRRNELFRWKKVI